MESITCEELFAYFPAYFPEYKAFIPGGKNTFTTLDVLEIEEIPAGERLSAVICGEFISPSRLHEFACRCAERTLRRVKNPAPRSVAAIKAKRAWMKGEISDAELAAARAAARDAARAAAWGAAWAAAWVAARAAAWDAAMDAEWVAERAWQVEELKKMLREAEA